MPRWPSLLYCVNIFYLVYIAASCLTRVASRGKMVKLQRRDISDGQYLRGCISVRRPLCAGTELSDLYGLRDEVLA